MSDVRVFGKTVDEHTRCEHYSTDFDIIAICFACCDRYYPCHLCHSECADHQAEQWPRDQWEQPAILCGMCRRQLTIETYKRVDACPGCAAPFNRRCAAHSDLYFAG
ncbi:CHY zinc finger protein [Brevibacterium sp. GP-SGM9]|uniref:CHY zinc finger protein n=1 Tax=Brevibacterium sp. GP-SGM9 TaxID=3376990 RepID=UPI0039A4B417